MKSQRTSSLIYFLALGLMSLLLSSCASTVSVGLPTYSEVLQSYPGPVRLCKTEAELKGIDRGGNWLLKGDIDFVNNEMQVQCYGTKITVSASVSIDGKTYPAGTLLTVDKDLNWIAVSSWK